MEHGQAIPPAQKTSLLTLTALLSPTLPNARSMWPCPTHHVVHHFGIMIGSPQMRSAPTTTTETANLGQHLVIVTSFHQTRSHECGGAPLGCRAPSCRVLKWACLTLARQTLSLRDLLLSPCGPKLSRRLFPSAFPHLGLHLVDTDPCCCVPQRILKEGIQQSLDSLAL